MSPEHDYCCPAAATQANTIIGDQQSHHLAAPLTAIGNDEHVALRPLLYKLWIASQVLELGSETTFTALVLLHRYYYYHCIDAATDASNNGGGDDNDTHEWKWIGAACLVLGMKAEEEVRRLRDVINVAQMLNFGLADDGSISGDEQMTTIDIQTTPPALNQEYWKAKEWIVATEQHVLRVLQFDVLVSHPHRLVVLVVKDLNLASSTTQDAIISRAWQHLNPALFHAPTLMSNALTLACSAVELEIQRGPHTYGSGAGNVEACMKQLLKAAATMKKHKNGRPVELVDAPSLA